MTRPTIILTGASGGLGRALAFGLWANYDLIGTYWQTPIESMAEHVAFYRMNVQDAESVAAFAAQVLPMLGPVVLVNLAGVSIDGMAHKLAEDAWDQVLNTNLKGAWLMSRAFLPHMRAFGWGRIVNVSSVVGQMGVPGTAAYAASKSGLFGLTRTLAAENATKGVTVNALALGYFQAGMGMALTGKVAEAVTAKIPMGKFGDSANVSAAIRFCIAADYMTGAVIPLNGGLL